VKRILLVANTSWYLYNFRGKFIERCIKSGLEVFVFAPRDQYSKKLSELGANYLNVIMGRKSINPLGELKTFFSLVQVMKKIRPDLVINYTIKLMFIRDWPRAF